MQSKSTPEARAALCDVYTFLLRRRYARLAQQAQAAAALALAGDAAAAADDPAPEEQVLASMEASAGLSTHTPDYGGVQ
ncbi:MAG TPA: hypothetical protein PKH77_04280 [Anaerolineae bacterium]|nr:hypothetical protein [Anaerolineae bacterium]